MTLKQIREKLEEKQKILASIFEKAKNENGEYDFANLKDQFFGEAKSTKEKLEKIHQAEAELNDLADEAIQLAKAEKDWDGIDKKLKDSEPSKIIYPSGKDKEEGQKSLGDLVTNSKEYKDWERHGGLNFKFEELWPGDVLAKANIPNTIGFKTLMSTTAGYAPESLRIGGFVEAVTRPIQLLDIMPMNRTSSENVVYMEETTRTHAAAEKAEGTTYAESTFAFTERTSAVSKITDSLPVTDEQLEDVPMIEGYINGRLLFGLRQRLDYQIQLGNGTPPNLRGIKNVVGIQTQAKGTDPTPDAFFKAMTLLRVTGRVMPTHHIIHPSDWEEIRLLRTADGVYIWGSPSEAGIERMWGLPVVQTDADSAGTGYCISAQPAWMSLFERRGVDVQVGYTGTQFVEGKRTIRADTRFAFVVFRPAAICSVTGI
jgi:HK97 family phage major capsid protein